MAINFNANSVWNLKPISVDSIRSEVYDEDQVLALYGSVGWVAYTRQPEILKAGFEHSLLILGAYEGDALIGLLRAVGDGQTVVLLQDILVRPDHQRQGIGSALIRAALARFPNLRQFLLITDDTPETAAFYESLGFKAVDALGCKAFMRA